jgi:hypothetical protein
MRLLKQGLALAAVVFLAACLDKLTTSLEPETGSGQVYTLITVNDMSVPAVIYSGQTRIEVRRGALTLAPDSTWIVSYLMHTTTGGSEQSNISTLRGVYSLTNASLTLTLSAGTAAHFTGTYSTTDVSLQDVSVANGLRLLFRR